MLNIKQKNVCTRVGTMQYLSFTSSQPWDESLNKKLAGFYAIAAAGNTEPVLIANAEIMPSHHAYWPSDLKVAAGETKFFEHTGAPIEFVLATGGSSQILRILPIYMV